MKAIFGLASILFLAQGCQRSADPVAIGDTVSLELLGNSLSRKGLVQEYEISNRGPEPIYFVCPESSCGDAESSMALPFYEVHAARTLAVYAHFVRMPGNELDTPLYSYVLKRVEPGIFRGKIEIQAPLQSNPPHPPPPFRPQPIDGFWIDRVQLTLGTLPCPEADLKPRKGEASEAILHFNPEKKIRCGSSQGLAKDFQKLISAETRVEWSGCWPNAPHGPGEPNPCEAEDDAGR